MDCYIAVRIASGSLDQYGRNLSRQITPHEEGEISPKNRRYISDLSSIYLRFIADISAIYCHQRRFFHKIADISPIYRRYFGDIYGNIFLPIFLHEISCRLLSIHDISAIYHRYIPKFSSLGRSSILIETKSAFMFNKSFNYNIDITI